MSPYYKDDTPIFFADNDPFIVRFRVKPVAWLEKERDTDHATPRSLNPNLFVSDVYFARRDREDSLR